MGAGLGRWCPRSAAGFDGAGWNRSSISVGGQLLKAGLARTSNEVSREAKPAAGQHRKQSNPGVES